MKSKFIIPFLRIASTVMFYVLILITIFVIGDFIFKLISKEKIEYVQFGNNFVELKGNDNLKPFAYSNDRVIRYKKIDNLYSVEVAPDSVSGYYYIATTSLFLGLGMFLLWNFKEIFCKIQHANPFNFSVVKRIRSLAVIFIVSGILAFINYFVFEYLIHHSLASPELKMVAEKGNEIIIGLIILAISIVYQRGVEIYEENSLTV